MKSQDVVVDGEQGQIEESVHQSNSTPLVPRIYNT
jgi:hypothetical protein